MIAKILDGKILSKNIQEELKKKIIPLAKKPLIVFILIGENIESQKYLDLKMRVCKDIGFDYQKIVLEDDVSEKRITEVINELNSDSSVNGILIQLPLPFKFKNIEDKIVNLISENKDIDGLTQININKILSKNNSNNLIIPCLSRAIIDLIYFYEIDLINKNVLICTNNKVEALVLNHLLKNKTSSVNIINPANPDLKVFIKQSDILVIDIHKPEFIKQEDVKEKVVIFDIGNNYKDNKVLGDVDFEDVLPKVTSITPVPGGVGPMIITSLMKNIHQIFINQVSK